jgi:hypothetical protein
MQGGENSGIHSHDTTPSASEVFSALSNVSAPRACSSHSSLHRARTNPASRSSGCIERMLIQLVAESAVILLVATPRASTHPARLNIKCTLIPLVEKRSGMATLLPAKLMPMPHASPSLSGAGAVMARRSRRLRPELG